ncbi:MAG: DNA repair protein RecO [Chitinophagaceae bacterium]|nr:DNA repair protein RecO [Chitinophagaceae bacterium]MBL0054979.1 DNA repair protein RecO [Chitinophagaceae bacterium]
MTHKTKGIVLRAIKYGETSLVVTLFTEAFGIQTYMVNGVRSSKRKSGQAGLFQPSAILELVVYHHESKSMQRIRDFGWAHLYRHLLQDVVKNSIASFMVELVGKCLKQPEKNPELFAFCEDAFHLLDTAEKQVAANFPLFFTLHLAHFFGFRITDNHNRENVFLDLSEGLFTPDQPVHPHFLAGEEAATTALLLKVMHPDELSSIQLNRTQRRQLLLRLTEYYALHIPDFGQMKTLMVLHEVL